VKAVAALANGPSVRSLSWCVAYDDDDGDLSFNTSALFMPLAHVSTTAALSCERTQLTTVPPPNDRHLPSDGSHWLADALIDSPALSLFSVYSTSLSLSHCLCLPLSLSLSVVSESFYLSLAQLLHLNTTYP